MIDLESWQFKKRVKIVTTDGWVYHCDTEYYVPCDEGELTIVRNKDSEKWNLPFSALTLELKEIVSIEHY